ncbi:MAG: DNA primase [Actinomycetaceae bacterium]|nr:DNA primase [Actinomycetaceae bacterium]
MAGLIRKEDIARVRDAVSIDDIVSNYVTLRPAGVDSMKGLCPFHDEKTPSFHVRPLAGLWHCFGCGEGGDVISFLQQIDHLSFTEAVEYLAHKAGITLQYEQGSRRPEEFGRRQRLIDMHKIAEEFYISQLATPPAQIARDFLAQRGFSRTASEMFGVGYAPDSWDSMTRLLRSRGFTDQEIVRAGLVVQKNQGIYDRFRNRLMWPIRDLTGATIGFGARRLGEDDMGAKYYNTPDSPIYHKSTVLYGIDLAKRNIAKKRQVVIVEGYTDVMAAHLAGIDTAVATCGTAFGAEHVKVIRRLLGDVADPAAGLQLASGKSRGGEVIFTFDGDEAGRKAALKAFAEDQSFASQTFVAIEQSGMDPCDLRMSRGDEAVRALIAAREPLFKFVIRSTLASVDLDTVEGRVRGLRATAPIVAGIRDRALQREYARELAGWVAMDERDVFRAVIEASRTGQQSTSNMPEPQARAPQPRAAVPRTNDPVGRLERQALEALLQRPFDVVGTGFDDLDGETFTVPAYRAAHDMIRAVGGLASFLDHLQVAEAECGVGEQANLVARSRWTDSMMEEAPEVIGSVLTELIVAPLPQDDPEKLRDYARGVVIALVRMGLTRQIGHVKALLGRIDSDSEQYTETFRQLLVLEDKRRALGRLDYD